MTTTAAPAAARSWSLDKTPRWVGGVIGIVLMVLVWWLASETLFQTSRSIPTPWSVVRHYGDAADWDRLRANFTPTTIDALWGFLWGDLLALVAAALVLLVPPLSSAVNQVAVVTYCLPPIAIGAILVEAAPLGSHIPPITLAALAPFFTTVVGSLVGLQAASRSSLDLITAYGGSSFTQLRKVQVIAALPNIFAALKIAAPASFLGAVLGDFVGGGGDKSIGVALLSAETNVQPDVIGWIALSSGAVAGIGYLAVAVIARFVTPWSSGKAGGPQ